MKLKAKRKLRSTFALAMTVILSLTTLGGGFSGLIPVKAAEEPAVTTTVHSYDFISNTGKVAPVLGGVLDGTTLETTGIIWYATEGNGVSFDATQLKFRPATTICVPIKDDTTKITYTQTCSGDSATRLTFVGGKDSTYTVAMAKAAKSVTVEDITDIVKVIDGRRYIPLYSNGDVKVTKITLTEYNPINTVTVSGKVANASENGISEISFKNLDNAAASVVVAAVDSSGNYTTTLKRIAGSTAYVASVSKTGYKVDSTASANTFTLTGNTASAEYNFSIVAAEVAKLSGTLTGVPDSALKDIIKLKLIPADNTLDTVYLDLTKVSDGNYTYADAIISPDVVYTAVLENANDYEVVSTLSKSAGIYTGVALNATAKPLQKVSGSFVTSDEKSAVVSKITFSNMNEAGYSYTFDVTGNTYSASLRAGEYLTSSEVSGYTVFDHVSVKAAEVTNNVYLEAPAVTTAVEYKEVLNVGKGKEFETITEALSYISRMTRTAEQRVTINLTDDLYREQVTVDTPNVTITSSNTKAPTITWYYGIGYSYYSVAPATELNKGYYSEKYAVDKYTRTVVDTHWGTAVEVTAKSSGFRAENITFESSFNRYMTTEEVTDGVGQGGDAAKINRSVATDADVKTTANKERACTMYIEADNCEYNNCSFLSSQDTMFTGNGEESIYFKNCVIEGTTDFICGSGNPVFDNCTLSIYGYGNQAADGGYITASKAGGSKGYLFYNCKIVRTTYAGINTTTKNIFLGRPWGAGTKVLFYNTEAATSDLIAPAGYASMSTVTPADAFYSEYNMHTPDGTALDTAGRATGAILLTADQAKAVSVTSYFGDWNPVYYYADYTSVDQAITKANALTAADYVDFTAVTTAVNAVVRNYTAADQTKVDAMAKAINDAVAALVKKPVAPDVPVTPEVPTVPEIPAKTVVKEKTVKNEDGQAISIKLTAKEGVIPESANLGSVILTAGSEFTIAKKAITENSRFTLFDMNILNAGGSKIQPEGSLDISLDIPVGYANDKIKVYRIEEDGSRTDMKAYVQSGKVIFSVSHFSLYAIVEEAVVNAPVVPTVPTVPDAPAIVASTDTTITADTAISADANIVATDVKTSDTNVVWVYFIAIAASFGTVAGVRKRKRA